MLVSHRYKFIFFKTIKTAGTSIEIALEPYCRAYSIGLINETTDQVVSSEGIVGARGEGAHKSKFYNHMPARAIKRSLGDEIWLAYRKITVVRNPFDKVVSWFWMHVHNDIRAKCQEDFGFAVDTFQKWLKVLPNLPIDKQIYSIKGDICCDDVIKYESLDNHLNDVADKLGIKGPIRLELTKSNARRRGENYSLYYDDVSKRIVSRHYKFEITHFGYQCGVN